MHNVHETHENDYGNLPVIDSVDEWYRMVDAQAPLDGENEPDRTADADEQQAEAAMADVDAYDDAAELDEAIRIAREEADAAEQEYDRLVAYRTRRETTEARLAQGACAAVDAVANIFTRRIG